MLCTVVTGRVRVISILIISIVCILDMFYTHPASLPPLWYFTPTDQIDENLKLTLQEDLTSMAPGLIIQVQ